MEELKRRLHRHLLLFTASVGFVLNLYLFIYWIFVLPMVPLQYWMVFIPWVLFSLSIVITLYLVICYVFWVNEAMQALAKTKKGGN